MPILILLFIALPILELLVIIEVARGIGVAPTVAALFATAIVGAFLVHSQGRAAWRRFQLALGEGRIPARETADGALIIVGGTLLVTPGFVTDVVGISLLVPGSRALYRRGLGFLAGGRVALLWRLAGPRSRPSGTHSPGSTPPPPPRGGRAYDFEGSAREVGDNETELPPAEEGR